MATDGDLEDHGGQWQPEPKKTVAQERDDAIVREAVENFAFVNSVEHDQRKQEDEDLQFEAGDQWGTFKKSREEHTDEVTGRKIPARPALTINLVDQPIQSVLSEARSARLAVTVKPKAGLANTTDAGYYKGLIRAIQADSGAVSVRLWSLERTAKCGRGFYEIQTDYANDGDFDLDIVIERVLNQRVVYLDPYYQKADASDADWALIADWMSEKERLRRWPDKPVVPPEGAFESQDHPWFTIEQDSKQRNVMVARYFRVTYEKKLLVYHPTTGPKFLDELPVELQEQIQAGTPGTRQRNVEVRKITLYIIDGTQILEEHVWPGRYIPIVPVIGKEYNVKAKRSWKGITTNMKDLGRGYNVAISSAVELVGTMPRAPYIMYAGQDEGFEEMWDDSPIKNYTRLYVNPVTVDGKPAPFPQRQLLEPQIQSVMFLARSLRDDVGAITGSVDPVTRSVRPYDRSGKAIEALQRQGAAGTSNYLDNLATISMMHEGRILVDLIPKIYDRPGRIIRVMGEENDDETAIMIKRPFYYDEEENPVPVPCATCRGAGIVQNSEPHWRFGRVNVRNSERTTSLPIVCPGCNGTHLATKENMPQEYEGKKVHYVDFAGGEFKVAVSIGRGYQTKQEEAMAAMSELASAAPPLVPMYADLWVRAMGFSGSQEIADRIKASMPPIPGKDGKEGVPPIPPEMLMQVEQLKQQHAAALQQLEKATEMIRTDAVKGQAQKELQAMKIEAQIGLENLKQQYEVMKMGTGTGAAKELEVLKSELALMRQESQQRHETLLQALIARDEAGLAHELAASEAVRENQKELRAAARASVRGPVVPAMPPARQAVPPEPGQL